VDNFVEVSGLAKDFADEGRGIVQAVKGIDFHCGPGEVFGLLGANGAGKTTTLRMLATLLKPSAGTARVMGFDVREHALEVRRNLGFHSASTALYPRLTTRETLEFFARINKVPKKEVKSRVDGLIERFELQSYAHTRVERLSTGMRQKVSIARTVAHEPPVLIFDEPTIGLDVLNILQFHQCIVDLRASGKAILLSTHIMSEAEKLCDRIAIIHGGRILACNTMQNLREQHGMEHLEEIFVHLVEGA
jgi:sodium transport system ATP-binding protein